MVLGKKARPVNHPKRELTQAEELRIIALARWKVFRVYELAQIFRVPDRKVREIIRQDNPQFTESGVDPLPVIRLSFLLDERYSRALLKVTSLATLREETATPLKLLELGIDLVCWIYGVKPISFPGKMAVRSKKRIKDCPVPTRFAVLRRLALWSGRIPDCDRIEENLVRTRRKKNRRGDGHETRWIRTGYGHWLQGHMLNKICLYYGIETKFIRYHYPERGEYLSLGKLKVLSKLSVNEIHKAVKMKIPKNRIQAFFLSHGLKVKITKNRYTLKSVEEKND